MGFVQRGRRKDFFVLGPTPASILCHCCSWGPLFRHFAGLAWQFLLEEEHFRKVLFVDKSSFCAKAVLPSGFSSWGHVTRPVFTTRCCYGESAVKRDSCRDAIDIGAAYLTVENFRRVVLKMPYYILYIVLHWWRICISREHNLHGSSKHYQATGRFALECCPAKNKSYI